MKPILHYLIFVSILLSACNPLVIKRQVTGNEGLEILVRKTPILNTFQAFEPCANLEQTIDGITLQVKKMYVSQQTIVIGFITRTKSGKRYEPVKITLTYPSGASLKLMRGIGLYGSSDDLGITLPSTEKVDLLFFEENNSPKISLSLDSDLKISVREFSVWSEVLKIRNENEVGPFQFSVSLDNCSSNTK